VLPLTISGNPRIERVMVGRIELVSDSQRERLKKLAEFKEYDSAWVNKVLNSSERDRFLTGRSDYSDLGVKLPEHFETYIALGRFRNALIAAEAAKPEHKHLQVFLRNYSIGEYE
jgi:hypothetical protein